MIYSDYKLRYSTWKDPYENAVIEELEVLQHETGTVIPVSGWYALQLNRRERREAPRKLRHAQTELERKRAAVEYHQNIINQLKKGIE